VNLAIRELENRLKVAQDKFELLRLREDITTFMESPQFQQFSQSDKNRVEDLLVEVLAKEEQYKGCDPLRTILGY
jgi:cation transport regulator ChaC